MLGSNREWFLSRVFSPPTDRTNPQRPVKYVNGGPTSCVVLWFFMLLMFYCNFEKEFSGFWGLCYFQIYLGWVIPPGGISPPTAKKLEGIFQHFRSRRHRLEISLAILWRNCCLECNKTQKFGYMGFRKIFRVFPINCF